MAIIGRQVKGGGTASLLLTLADMDSTTPPVADAAPVVTIKDPKGVSVVASSASLSLGGGQYLYNYSTSATQVRGFYEVIFDYAVLGIPFREDFKFEVI